MNVIDWMRESSKFMSTARPDVWESAEAANADLLYRMEYLRGQNLQLGLLMSGGFILIRVVEGEGMEEFQLAQLISGVCTFYPEEDVMVYRGEVDGIDLPHITDSFNPDVDTEDEV